MPPPFSVTAGQGTSWVRLYERRRAESKGGLLYLEWFEGAGPTRVRRRKRVDLEVPRTAAAKAAATQVAIAFSGDLANSHLARAPLPVNPTVRALVDAYLEEKTPEKGDNSQSHDRLVGSLLKQLFGDRRVDTLGGRELARFRLKRAAGGLRSNDPTRPELGPGGRRAIERDLRCIHAMWNWGVRARDERGRRVLLVNPWAEFKVDKVEAERRPRFSEQQMRELQVIVDRHGGQFQVAFILATETGRRSHSWRNLRWEDVLFRENRLIWRSEFDKEGQPWRTPMTPRSRKALLDYHLYCKQPEWGWLFPSEKYPNDAMSRYTWIRRMQRAIELAEIPMAAGYGWHSLRRRLATELRRAPSKVVMQYMGWRTRAMLDLYQQVDDEMLEALADSLPNRFLTEAADAPEEMTPEAIVLADGQIREPKPMGSPSRVAGRRPR